MKPTELKRTWTNFLYGELESNTSSEWPCNVGIAEWCTAHGWLLHSIAVYEHLLRKVHQRGLSEAEDEVTRMAATAVSALSASGTYRKGISYSRAYRRFHGEGVIGAAEYAEVLASIPASMRREAREAIEKERAEADRRYREGFGDLITKLHDDTERCLVQAEVMSAGKHQAH